ncbi:MAG: GNAT family N-acetyltransferase [Pseudomonadota bacterium]|nr:GNAT family N-acetyltransferase [Pseudomonadota bacterium]
MKAVFEPPRPLAEADDRDVFDCGRESLNAWFRRHAWSNHAGNISRVTVLPDALAGRIAGYFTLSAAQIERSLLPKPQQRHRPEAVPALLLGQFAVDKAYQGRGLAVDLLRHAFRRALAASEMVGCMAVITHPLDEDVRGFYAKWGFQDLPFDPRRAMIVRIQDLRAHLGRNTG